jgi:hypothetical protein
MKYIETVIENKYDQNHSRIIRILKLHKSLDEKKIAEAALLSLKDARSVLFELF